MTDSGMDDLISRKAALDVLVTSPNFHTTLTRIEELPAVDAVPVIRCRDCKHWWKVNELCTHQRHVHGTVCAHECKAMDYCSDGERRDSE